MTTAPARVPWYLQPPPHVPRPAPTRKQANSQRRCVCGSERAVHTRIVFPIASGLLVRGRPAQASHTGCTDCACSIFEPDDGTASQLGKVPEGCSNGYSGANAGAVNGGER